MTGYFAKDIQPGWLIPVGVWMLLPYWVLLRLVRAAYSCTTRAVALVAALVVASFGFWTYFDRRFVHFSSIDNSPVEVPFEQLLIVLVGWLAVRRLQKRHGNEKRAI
jgi:hypothetical protein